MERKEKEIDWLALQKTRSMQFFQFFFVIFLSFFFLSFLCDKTSSLVVTKPPWDL